MELTVLIGVLLVLLIFGVPVAFALGIASMVTFYMLDVPLIVGFQRMAASMNIFALMAIPFFVFAGDLMHRAGIAERLIRVADAALGRTRGGLGQVNVGASMMFGAVSGSAIASVSAIGSTLGPMMKEKNYDADYVVNVSATSAITGLLIPPSHNMIIYAAAAGVSISLADGWHYPWPVNRAAVNGCRIPGRSQTELPTRRLSRLARVCACVRRSNSRLACSWNHCRWRLVGRLHAHRVSRHRGGLHHLDRLICLPFPDLGAIRRCDYGIG